MDFRGQTEPNPVFGVVSDGGAPLGASGGKDYVVSVETRNDSCADNRKWMPGIKQSVSLQLDCRHIPAGDYEIAMGMFEENTPIKWALKDTAFDGAFYTLGGVKVKEI